MLAAERRGKRMGASMQWLGELGKTLLARPDEIMLELGASGELGVARMRAVLAALILPLPLLHALLGATTSDVFVGLGAAVLLNIMSQVWLVLARDRRRHPWLPYATSTHDVTMTTVVLVLLTLTDRVAGINSIVVWAFYLIAIAMTVLRNDGRLTLYAGALAVVQYGLLAWVVMASAQSPEQLASPDHGAASAIAQVERVLLLLLMTLLTATIVYRMQRLVEMSGRDGLTGLPNRAWLLQRMPRVFDSVRASGGSLTLALLDLDNFKRINDEIGHLAGDRAIRHIASAMSEILEEQERVVRLGGQEFVLLLHCPIGSAWERLDRLRRAFGEQPFLPERGADPQRITFSGGLAAFPQDGSNTSTLLRSADRRLQQAKREGRNRVVARDV